MTHRHCEENVPTRRWICRKFDEMQCMSGCVDGKRGFGVDCLEHGHVQTRGGRGLGGRNYASAVPEAPTQHL